MIRSWWTDQKEFPPFPEMMPEESTWIAEIDGIPILSLTMYLTNGGFGWAENFIGNPNFRNSKRKDAANEIVAHMIEFAKSKGLKRIVCMSEKQKLVFRYSELGFTETLNGLTSLVREI